MNKAVFIFLFNLIISTTLNSQTGSVLYSLNESDGLTDNSVNCFFEDSRGLMWLGTNFGLNNYDGSVVRNFHPNKENSFSDVINDIKELNGELWIATGGGLVNYNFTTKRFATYVFQKNNEVLNRYYSLAIFNNKVLLATENGLVVFDIDKHSFKLIQNASFKAANRITKIFVDSKQQIWVATYQGLWLFNSANETFKKINLNEQQNQILINQIFEDHSGNLWLGTWSDGLIKLIPKTHQVVSYVNYKASSTNVLSIAEIKSDSGYKLLTNTYLKNIDTLSKSFYPFMSEGTDKTFLKSATQLFTDRNNLLWIASEQGVKIYDPGKQYFYTKVFSDMVPLTTQGISLFPLQGKFIMGAEGTSALQLFSDSLKPIKNYASEITGGAAVMSIVKDKHNNYWLGTSLGLIQLNSDLKKIKTFVQNDKEKKSLPRNFITSLFLKQDGELWLMPWRKGIWKMDSNTVTFSRVTTIKGDTLLRGANIAKAIEDERGTIWLTDFNDGLIKYIPSTGEVKKIISPQRLTNQILINGKLWTVSSGNIYAVNSLDDKIETYPLPLGQNKYVYDFMADAAGVLWIATKSGLVAFNSNTKQFQLFTASEGLHNNVAEVTFASLSNGNLLMAGNTYATLFSPSIAFHAEKMKPLIYTGASLNGNEKQMVNGELTVEWHEKNIQLNWALLNYSNPKGNTYYCKLDGADKDWHCVGNKGTIAYNSLEPGHYIFRYKAATSSGLMSAEQIISITVNPPIYKTWWFMLLSVAIILLVFYYVVRYVSQRNLKEQLLKLEKEQAIEKERNRISRDMHDELGSGLTKIAILTEVVKTQTGANDNIDKISNTARQMVDNLDEMVWALNPRNDTLEQLATYMAEYAQQYFENTGINCTVDVPVNILEQHVGEEMRRNIFMVLKEFINNTVKHSQAKNISITVLQQAASFSIYLKDDGCGFDTSVKSSTGNGIINMLQRIKDTGGRAQLSSGKDGTSLNIQYTTSL